MLKSIFFGFLITCTLSSMGQKTGYDDFQQKIDSIQVLMSIYDTLSPFSGPEDRLELIDSVGGLLTDQLFQLLNDKRILNYSIATILRHNALDITTSNDHQLALLSFEEKMGGSYRSMVNIIYFRLPNGKVKADYFDEGYYGNIYVVDSENQVYMVEGNLITCNTCISVSAIQLTLQDNTCIAESFFSFEGRWYDLKTTGYDPESKEFTYEYTSAHNDDTLYGQSENENHLDSVRVTTGTYSYLNGKFTETEVKETIMLRAEYEEDDR